MKIYPEEVFIRTLEKTPVKINNWRKTFDPVSSVGEYTAKEIKRAFICQIKGLISQALSLGFAMDDFEYNNFPEAFDVALTVVEKAKKDFMKKFEKRFEEIESEKLARNNPKSIVEINAEQKALSDEEERELKAFRQWKDEQNKKSTKSKPKPKAKKK